MDVGANRFVADSTHKEKIAEKLTALSHMSGEEVISMIIRGALDISARILIALSSWRSAAGSSAT